jgi:hypothetical protein
VRVYVVRQGDFLGSIAWAHAVSEDAIWRAAPNAALVKLRESPNVLYPGDVLYIPDAKPTRFALRVGANNAFEAQVPTTELKLVFGDDVGPWSGEAYRVEGIVGLTLEGSTDGEGRATLAVPITCRSIMVVFPGRGRRFRVDVGHLDPVSEPSGVRARLQHLGYLRPVAPGEGDAFDRAVRDFQRAKGLDATGELTRPTLDALVESYGS